MIEVKPGRCGDAAPVLLPGGTPAICELRAGHAGWHEEGSCAWAQTAAEPAPPTDGLREEIAQVVFDQMRWPNVSEMVAGQILALPGIQRLIAAEEAVGRVRELADWLDRTAADTDDPNPIIAANVEPQVLAALGRAYRDDARRIRRALDGDR